MKPSPKPSPNPTPRPRPNAVATVEPQPTSHDEPAGEHLLRLTLEVSAPAGSDDARHVLEQARRALDVVSSANDGSGRRCVDEIPSRSGKDIVGVEAALTVRGRPHHASMQALRVALLDAGYKVSIRETRACTQPGCPEQVTVAWNRSTLVPPGWHSHAICGRHDLKTCAGCGSVYRMSSSNAAEHAPSLHCQVCGRIMVEWGSTKTWSAELVTEN